MFFYEHKTCLYYRSTDFAVFLSFKQLSYLLIKWKRLYIFAIDYKLKLRLVKINGNPDRRGGLWYCNPVAGAGGGGDLDLQGQKSCHPFESQDG